MLVVKAFLIFIFVFLIHTKIIVILIHSHQSFTHTKLDKFGCPETYFLTDPKS